MVANNQYKIQIGKGIKAGLFDSVSSFGGILIIFIIFGVFCFIFSMSAKEAFNNGFLLGIGFLIIPFIIFFVVIIGFGLVFSAFSMKFTSYDLDNKTFIFKNGIIARSEKNLPYSKIQHIVLYETLGQRILGIASISIETAGESGFIQQNQNQGQVRMSNGPLIPNLLKKDAEKLKNYLLEQIRKTKTGSGI